MARRRWSAALLATALLSVAACAPSPGPRAQARTWADGTGLGRSLLEVRGGLSKAKGLINAGADAGALHTVCGALLLNVESANGNLPSPDPTLSRLLSEGYEKAGAAAHDCFDAGADPAKRSAFAADRTAALSLLAEAAARAESVLGGPLGTAPSTTTAGSL